MVEKLAATVLKYTGSTDLVLLYSHAAIQSSPRPFFTPATRFYRVQPAVSNSTDLYHTTQRELR